MFSEGDYKYWSYKRGEYEKVAACWREVRRQMEEKDAIRTAAKPHREG